VARMMVAGQASGQHVATSVSGFLFCGNAGNIIDGYIAPNGLPYSQWGSDELSLEGFFDLGQLMIPTGQTAAQYQLSVEALDPSWSMGVEPYASTQVIPSGSFVPIVITVQSGSNVEQDVLMLQDEVAQPNPGSDSTYANPAALPQGGAWGAWISGYGMVDFFQFTAQANRTASIAVTALDESGQPTETKLLPVIGIWELSDQTGDPAPASTPSAFNSTTFGMTRLDAQFGASEAFRVGVADFRGDGRPDYFYQASLLYSDTVIPPRLSLAGGVTTLNGIGFSQGLQVSVAGNTGSTLSASASQLQVSLPAGSQDGTATIQVTNPATGAFSQMIDALTYGASPTDLLFLLQGAEPSTPVGSQAANPIRVRAVAADGVTPVSGATIAWSATNGMQFLACSGASSCSVLSDEAGEASSLVTPMATGQSTITIALAPASYSPPQSQQATVVATSTTLDLAAVAPTRWVGQGATLAVPLTVEALDLGVPLANITVNFAVKNGTASLSSGSATTNGSGFATITAQLTNLTANVQVSACVAPNNSPCSQPFVLYATPTSLWTLQTVSGSSQVVLTGQAFQPLVMRVTDGSTAENPVMGVSVTFATTLAQVAGDGPPILLGSSESQVVTAQDGTASIVPSAGSVGPCSVFITVSAGQSTAQLQMESLAAIVPVQPENTPGKVATVESEPHIDFGAQPPTPQALPIALVAVPEAAPSNDPAADSHPGTCPESSADDAPGNQGASASSSPAGNENSVSPPCEKPKPAEVKAQKKPASVDNDIVPTDAPTNDGAPTNVPAPAVIQPSPSSSSWLPEDKRSCRALAGDGPQV